MAEVVRRELRRRDERAAAKKREEKEKEIQEKIINLIKKYNLRIKRLEQEIAGLLEKERKFISEGKGLRAGFVKWRREKKQRELEDLKRITPSIKFQ